MNLPKSFFSQIIERGNLILLDETIYHLSLHDSFPAKDYWHFCGKRLKLERSGKILDYELEYFTEYHDFILPVIEQSIEDALNRKKDGIKRNTSNVELAVKKRYVDFIVNRVFPEYREKGPILEKFSDGFIDSAPEIKKTEIEIMPDIYTTFLRSFFQEKNQPSGWELLKNKNFAIIDNEYYDLVSVRNANQDDYVEIKGRRYSLHSNASPPIKVIEMEYQKNIERRIQGIVMNKETGLLKDIEDVEKEERLLMLAKCLEHEEADGLGFTNDGHYTVYISNLNLRPEANEHYCSGVAKPKVGTIITLGSNNEVSYTPPFFVGGTGFPCHGGWRMESLKGLSSERQVAMLLYHGKRMAERIEFRNGNLVMMH